MRSPKRQLRTYEASAEACEGKPAEVRLTSRSPGQVRATESLPSRSPTSRSPGLLRRAACSAKIVPAMASSFRNSSRASNRKMFEEEVRRNDLLRFRPSVLRRVRTIQLAKKHFSVHMLLLLEERTEHVAAPALQVIVTAVTFASTVLLVLLARWSQSSAQHTTLLFADLCCSAVLLVEWLARCCLHFMLRISHNVVDEQNRADLALGAHLPWLIFDGISSLSYSGTAAVALTMDGEDSSLAKSRALAVMSSLRLFRLLSLARYSMSLDLLTSVMWLSARALLGPMSMAASRIKALPS